MCGKPLREPTLQEMREIDNNPRTLEQRKLISDAAKAVELIPEDELEDHAQKLRRGGLI